ncbi:MAG: hypothetical protein J0H71_04490 [Rhizobiales bacterium]|nr:hypothetical protein [Hyphomicrobiales bacterium]
MRDEREPRMLFTAFRLVSKSDGAEAGLTMHPVRFGQKRVIVHMIDLGLIVTRQDRTNGKVIAALPDHGLHRLIVRMSFEKSHHMEIVATKPQDEWLHDIRRQTEAGGTVMSFK